MLKLLVLSTLLSLCLGEEEAQASRPHVPVILRPEHHNRKEDYQRLRDWGHREEERREHRREHHEHHDRREHHEHEQEHDEGPLILRTIKPHYDGHGPDIERQNKIIERVYSPDYAEPTWILDYRYLKTGGRDYTRGPGGQILILPKGVRTKEPKEFENYDELIEHLRLKNLEERNKPRYFMPLGDHQHYSGGHRREDPHVEHHDEHRDAHWAPHNRHDEGDYWKGH